MSDRSIPKLVLVSRHVARVEQWRTYIEAQGHQQVVGCSRGLSDTAALASRCDPDAIVSDLELTDASASQLVRRTRQAMSNPGMQILIVAPRADHPELLECLRQGADSYFVDQGPGPTLDSRIQEMLLGESKMSPEIARQVLDHFRRSAPSTMTGMQGHRSVDDMLNPLLPTERERMVLIHLVQGRTVPEIANLERLPLAQVARCVRALYRRMEWDLRAGDLQLAQF